MERARTLLIEAGGTTWALPLESARALAPVGPPVPLPHAPPGLLGLVNLRGEVLPLFDAGALVGADRSGPAAHALVIVLEAGRAALAVDGPVRLAGGDPGVPTLDLDSAVAALVG